MPKGGNSSRVILTGAFEVDLGSRQLRRDGQRIALEEMPFDVLALLVERPGKPVPPLEIQQKLWPADLPADPQRSLEIAIRRLKQALGDTGTPAGYVEVLPDGRYRFAAKVSKRATGSTPVLTPPPAPARWRTGVKWGLSVAAAVALVVGGKYIGDMLRPPIPQRIKLAVLPFKCLSGRAEDTPMCDGLTEEVAARLGRVSPQRLGVIAATSVWQFKETRRSVQDIGRSLGVDRVVEGSVDHEGGQVRISAKLIQVADETQAWSETYNRNYSDLLTLERDVAVSVVEALIPKLEGVQAQAARGGTENPRAHEAYVRGRYEWRKRTGAGFQQSIQFYNEAIHLDPNYAQAYAGLADTYDTMGFYGMLPPAASYERAREAAKKALEIDDSLGEAHAALAEVLMHYDYDWAGAREEFEKAIRREENYASAHDEFSLYLALCGDSRDGMKELQRAHDLDPFSLVIAANWSLQYYYARDYAKAITKAQEAVTLEPRFALSHFWLGRAYEAAGDHARAIVELQEATKSEPGLPLFLAVLGHAYGAAGRRTEAMAVLKALEDASRQHSISPVLFSLVYTGMGDKERALHYADDAYRERAPLLTRMKRDPILDGLRQEPRFVELVEKVGPPN